MVSAFQLISGSKVPLRHLPHQQTLSSSLQSHLYLLVTDQGFLQEEQVVWESLHNVDGDSCFCDSDFHLSHSLGKGPGAGGGSGSPKELRQVDQVCGASGKGAESPSSNELFTISKWHAHFII